MTMTIAATAEVTWATCPEWCDSAACSGILDSDEGFRWVSHRRALPIPDVNGPGIELVQSAYDDGDRITVLDLEGMDVKNGQTMLACYSTAMQGLAMLQAAGEPFEVHPSVPRTPAAL